jgi:L-iditol 2-dehydrogenase
MKGLVKFARGDGHMEIRDVAEPFPQEGQVKIEIKAAGICGSDLHIYHDDINFFIRTPVVVGHEFSGVVTEVGKGVTVWKPGDRVTAETSYEVCGRCDLCRSGFYNLCPERRVLGYWFNGAFTKYTIVPQHVLYRLPENVDFIEGAFSEPLACCVHGILELTHIAANDVVVISGPGPIGLLSLQLAKANGGKAIVLGTTKDKERMALAGQLGAEVLINVEEENALERVRDLTGGKGADVILECSGAAPAARLGLELVRKRGQYTQIGLFGRPIEIDFERIAYKEIEVRGTLSQRWTAWVRTMGLLAEGKVKLKPIVSDVWPISRWKEAFDKLEAKKGMKIMLTPEG